MQYTGLIFSLVGTIASIALAAHLFYMKDRSKPLLIKSKTGTSQHGLLKKFYSPKFIVIAICIALSSVLSLSIDALASIHRPLPEAMRIVEFIVRMSLDIVALYFAYDLFWKKR